MSIEKNIQLRTRRRAFRVRNKLRKVNRDCKMRVSIFRSNRGVYAQIIDDAAGRTVVSFSSIHLEKTTGDKTTQARLVGVELGKRALAQSIERVYFDRGSYLYHGRVKALADGLRESGLQF